VRKCARGRESPVRISVNATESFGDTSVISLWRIYEDQIHHVQLNLGVSLPTGSTTRSMTMLSPMNMAMAMRASYDMQLGSGTVDLLPGASYVGHIRRWSWGAIWRTRLALEDNTEGYRHGDLHEISVWGGYTLMPGITTTARLAGTDQNPIHNSDPMIAGLAQDMNPSFYGKQLDLLGGIDIAGARFGLNAATIAIEAGGAVFQNLNGPQLGQA
jgi:hypothetical protein